MKEKNYSKMTTDEQLSPNRETLLFLDKLQKEDGKIKRIEDIRREWADLIGNSNEFNEYIDNFCQFLEDYYVLIQEEPSEEEEEEEEETDYQRERYAKRHGIPAESLYGGSIRALDEVDSDE